jgi:replication factor A1
MPAFQQQQQQQQQQQPPPPQPTAQGRTGAGGNITDFFGRQPLVRPATGGSGVGGFMPIKELSPYTSGRWRIKGRILTKSDIRRFSNARGEGQLFKVDIGDRSGEISGTFFGKAVDQFYPMLRQGQVYVFSRAHVKPANPRFDRGDVVLTFEDQSLVEAAEDDQEIPGVTFDFSPICSVPALEQHTLIDVQAIIYAVQEPFHFTSKTSNREMVKREIGIWDASGPDGGSVSTVTVWGERALGEGFEVGTPVFMKAVRVSEWNGNKELSSPAVIEMNPDDTRAFTLKAKYEEFQKTRPMPMRGSTQGGTSGGRKTAQEVREEDMQLGPPPVMGQALDPNGPKAIHRHNLQATISQLPTDRMPCYASCPALVTRASGATQQSGQAATERACQKKVTQEGPNMWRCANGHVCQNPTFRYLCKMQVMDHTECLEVNVFDAVAKQFFGVEADAYTRIYEDPSLEAQLQQIHKNVLWRRLNFRLRAQKEVWQDVERVRYHVDDVSSISFAKDARQMLTEVKAALATGQN